MRWHVKDQLKISRDIHDMVLNSQVRTNLTVLKFELKIASCHMFLLAKELIF